MGGKGVTPPQRKVACATVCRRRQWYAVPLPPDLGTLEGFSRSTDRTFFHLPTLNVGLDAGAMSGLRPRVVLLTHGHIDHAADVWWAAGRRPSPGCAVGVTIVCQEQVLPLVRNYICAQIAMNCGRGAQNSGAQNGGAQNGGARNDGVAERGGGAAERGGGVAERGGAAAERGGGVAERGGAAAERSGGVAERGGGAAERGGGGQELPPGCELIGVTHGSRLPMPGREEQFWVHVFGMKHSVPCVGYGIVAKRKKLKPEFVGLTSAELTLRSKSAQLHDTVTVPRLAYLGDTSIEVFTYWPELLTYPHVVVECTFLDIFDTGFTLEQATERCARDGHILWSQLRPIVAAHPQTHFYLIHFSMRYSAQQISDFFARPENTMHNVTIMPSPFGEDAA